MSIAEATSSRESAARKSAAADAQKVAPPNLAAAPASVAAAPPSITAAPPSITAAPPSITAAPPSITAAPPSITAAPPGPGRRVFEAVRRRWRRFAAWADVRLCRVCARSGFLSSLYYFLFSPAFRREHQSFLRARVNFRENAASPRRSNAAFRRGIHRIEKGLLMRPRRPIFALDYIQEVCEYFERICRDPSVRREYERDELCWASDVLRSYFAVTGEHPKIDPLRERFQQLTLEGGDDGLCRTPYKRDLASPSPVDFEDLHQLSLRRRSVRWFLPKPVPRELIEKAMLVAAQSPSACNRQPFVFRVFDEPKLTKQVAEVPAGTVGFAHNFPAVAVVVGQQRSYCEERDRHVIYIDGALASMSFVYALETLGLASCCINWPDIEDREREMDRLLKLAPDERPIMLIAFGYPDPEGLVAFSQKKPFAQLCRFNYE
jgi:nitroreductase